MMVPSWPNSVRRAQRGFTLIEILVATALTLLMMGLVVTIFGLISDNVTGSRATLEMSDRMRAAVNRLQLDLEGATVEMAPPRSPERGEGYAEMIEGPIGAVVPPHLATSADVDRVTNTDPLLQPPRDGLLDPDTTAGDNDDILMLTTKSRGEPFFGRLNDTQMRSPVAEVAWFVRGTTLYRRQLLVSPGRETLPAFNNVRDFSGPSYRGYYANFDLSVRQVLGPFDRAPGAAPNNGRLLCNSLGDLTDRRNRFGHQPWAFPFDARFWGRLGLPTMLESSSFDQTNNVGLWPLPLLRANNAEPQYTAFQSPIYADALSQLIVPYATRLANGAVDQPLNVVTDSVTAATPPAMNPPAEGLARVVLTDPAAAPASAFDPWRRPLPWPEVHRATGGIVAYTVDPNPTAPPNLGYLRLAEDVILDNVLSFDIKVWDPGAPVFLRPSAAGGNLVAVAPGDMGYGQAMRDYLNAPGNVNLIPATLGAFVDLNYLCSARFLASPVGQIDYPRPATAPANFFPPVLPQFGDRGNPLSRLSGSFPFFVANFNDANDYPPLNLRWPAVYDTWSTSYERDGFDQNGDGLIDTLVNGIDDDNANGVDDFGEQEAPPPYAAPLRAVQITVRVFEPDSRQIREVTIRQDYVR